MKKLLIGAALALSIAAPAAHAACTIEQLQQKAMAYSQKVQEVAQKNPQKLERFGPRAEEAGKKYQEALAQRGANYDDLCKLYDELVAELGKD
jgi:SOS response regulatory protein OraA/RecX